MRDLMYRVLKIKHLNGFEATKNSMTCKGKHRSSFNVLFIYFRTSTQPNQVNYQTVCDLYAEVVGVLAHSRFVIQEKLYE